MKKKDVGMLIGGTAVGMSTVMAGAAVSLIRGYFTRRKPHEPIPGQIETVDDMHVDYLRRKSIGAIRAQETEELTIRSNDGLNLHGHYVHNTTAKRKKNEPVNVVILSHGYGGTGYKDLSIFADFYIKEGYDILIIDQRTHGRSDGTYITFGAREHEDVALWVDRVVQIAGDDCRILLHGWSMGAATVYLAAAHHPAPQVRGVVFDCGYAVSEAQLLHAAQGFTRLPKALLWYVLQFLKPLCSLICGFSINEAAPLFVAAHMRLPIFFVHGEADSVVPLWMGRKLYRATTRAPYRDMLTVPDAEHTHAYVVDKKGYEEGLLELMKQCGMR
ncbi:MAG: alpha/beta fold hydrolase [Lachnospiraceae bacterium]|nr:alpha/beta fold hydrolase [Lachnospiraceae bacterium]